MRVLGVLCLLFVPSVARRINAGKKATLASKAEADPLVFSAAAVQALPNLAANGMKIAQAMEGAVSVYPTLLTAFDGLMTASPIFTALQIGGNLATSAYEDVTDEDKALQMLSDRTQDVVSAMSATKRLFGDVRDICENSWIGDRETEKGLVEAVEYTWAWVSWATKFMTGNKTAQKQNPDGTPIETSTAEGTDSAASVEKENPDLTEVETPRCKALRTTAIADLAAVRTSIDYYRPVWAWDTYGQGTLEDFGYLAFYYLGTDISWRHKCCPNNDCHRGRGPTVRAGEEQARVWTAEPEEGHENGGDLFFNASNGTEEPEMDYETKYEQLLKGDDFVLKDRNGKASDDASVFSVVDKRFDLAGRSLQDYVKECSDTLPLLFNHQSDEITRKAASVARCVEYGPVENTVAKWTRSALEYQEVMMSHRFDKVTCPALATAAVALIRGKGMSHVAALALKLVKGYLEEGCSIGDSDVGLTCAFDRLELAVSPSFRTQLGEDSAAALIREFAVGTVRLGVHEAIEEAHCWKPVPAERQSVITKALKRVSGDTQTILTAAWTAFQKVPYYAKDIAAINSVMSGGGAGVIFATGLPGLAVASAWLAWRFSVVYLAKLDFNDACRDGAFFMSGMMEASFCSVTIEKAFSSREDKSQDMQTFARSVMRHGASDDEKLKACLLGEGINGGDLGAALTGNGKSSLPSVRVGEQKPA